MPLGLSRRTGRGASTGSPSVVTWYDLFSWAHIGLAHRRTQENPKVKAGKEGAFEATIKFFHKYKDL